MSGGAQWRGPGGEGWKLPAHDHVSQLSNSSTGPHGASGGCSRDSVAATVWLRADEGLSQNHPAKLCWRPNPQKL